MIHKIFLLLIIILTYSSCISQNQDMESKMMDCLDTGFEDNGTMFKSVISDYEQDLISNNLITDKSGSSYLTFLRKIATNQKIENKWPESLTDRFINHGKSVRANMETVRKCQELIGSNEKIDSINDIILNSFDQKNQIIANRILTNLDKSDFEKDFYKLRILMIIDGFKPPKEESNLAENLPAETEFLDIYLNRENRIYLEGKIIDIERLNIELRMYFDNKNSKNDIQFFLSGKANYGIYTSVLNSITKSFINSRNDFSIQKFGKNYQDLNLQEKLIADDSYPNSAIE